MERTDLVDDLCGTHDGYQRHLREKTIPCEPCLKIHRLAMRQYRFRRGQQHDLSRCRLCGSVFSEHSCNTVGIRLGVIFRQSVWDQLFGGA